MKQDKSLNNTIILNKNDGDGFLNLNSPQELSLVMEVLKRLNGDSYEK